MKYKIGTISNQSGLAAQTIREYSDRGLLDMAKDAESNYRYFDANALNKASAIRRLRMMGFSLGEITELFTSASDERYLELLNHVSDLTQQQIESLQTVQSILENTKNRAARYKEGLYCGRIATSPAYFCFDYRKNGRLMCQTSDEIALLNQWMDQALYTKNYSPVPVGALLGEKVDHTIGFAVEERFADRVPTDAPIYYRPAATCAVFSVIHDDGPIFLRGGNAAITAYLKENRLSVCAEPFFIGDLPTFQHGEKVFHAELYVPVHVCAKENV